MCDKAVALAQEGYVGFALDAYGKGVLGTTVEENTRLMTPFMEDRDFLQQRLQAGYEALCALPQVDEQRVAAIGYSRLPHGNAFFAPSQFLKTPIL